MKRIRTKNINTREHFNEVFRETPDLYDSYTNINLYNKLLNLGLFNDGKYLDYGCGNGNALFKLKNEHGELNVIGVDISNEVIEKNKLMYNNCFFKTTDDFWTDPVKVNSVVSTHTFEHIEDPVEISKKLLDLTDKLFIIVPYKDSWKKCLQHIWRYDRKSFDFIKPDLVLSGFINEAGNQEVIYYWDKNFKKNFWKKFLLKKKFDIQKIMYHRYTGVIKKIIKLFYENNSSSTS